ncbi:hypothetical protein [Chenggangzhangella methanolivorans]|nr:hypothetical protein [Chenggangzhangella methanolivorans]
MLKPSKDRPYDIRDISFKGSTAYVLLGAYDANFTMTGSSSARRTSRTSR